MRKERVTSWFLPVRHEDEDGFSMTELMVVCLIIGILVVIAIPIYMNQQKTALIATVKTDVSNTILALKQHQESVGAHTGAINPTVSDTEFNNLRVQSEGNTITLVTYNAASEDNIEFCVQGTRMNGDDEVQWYQTTRSSQMTEGECTASPSVSPETYG